MVNQISQSVLSSLTTQPKGAPSSSTGKVQESSDVESVAQVVQPLPDSETKAAEKSSQKVDEQALDEALGQLNEFAQSVQRQLEFSVDEESGKTIVKVIDKESGQTIRSIPSEEVLNMQRRLKETSEAIFNSATDRVSLLFQGKA
ncbi:flagellar protein FlaG [Sedimenticola selenatireducens]|uniref:Flagellar protein FlaG n=1 Tax=Sedimenticola selenatireducens TaxID=191960 RepID=A0A558E0H3_9GAMM|nr:flagellar protein FlaG [Sedimenticola selenatireducens]TVO75285.1 flagellar protein FlaG [Sedimenticola selenatireducens]TVT66862.1 MAG: flagellar protein FlaG [Sedimenticola selenatireducens]